MQELHRKKKVREFPVPSRDVTTKLSLGGNYDVIAELFLPRGSLVSDIPAGDGKLVNLFLRCMVQFSRIRIWLMILIPLCNHKLLKKDNWILASLFFWPKFHLFLRLVLITRYNIGRYLNFKKYWTFVHRLV
jgi:hypothetical protein